MRMGAYCRWRDGRNSLELVTMGLTIRAGALALLSTFFALLPAACGDRSGEVLFYCDEWDTCADLPTTICSDRGICVCPNYNDIFCGEKCVPYEVCYPPPECTTDDAGAPDGG